MNIVLKQSSKYISRPDLRMCTDLVPVLLKATLRYLEIDTPDQWPSESSDLCWLFQTWTQNLNEKEEDIKSMLKNSLYDCINPDPRQRLDFISELETSLDTFLQHMKEWLQQKIQQIERHSDDVTGALLWAEHVMLHLPEDSSEEEEDEEAAPISPQPTFLQRIKERLEKIIQLTNRCQRDIVTDFLQRADGTQHLSETSEDLPPEEGNTEETVCVEAAAPFILVIYLQRVKEKLQELFELMMRRFDNMASTLEGISKKNPSLVTAASINLHQISLQRMKDWFQEHFELRMRHINTVLALQRCDQILYRLATSEDSSPQGRDTEETRLLEDLASLGNELASVSEEVKDLIGDEISMQHKTVTVLEQFELIIRSINNALDLKRIELMPHLATTSDDSSSQEGNTEEIVSLEAASPIIHEISPQCTTERCQVLVEQQMRSFDTTPDLKRAELIPDLSATSEDSSPQEGDAEETVSVAASAPISPPPTFLQRMRERFQKLIQLTKRRREPDVDHVAPVDRVSPGNESAAVCVEAAAPISPQPTFRQRMRERFQKLTQRTNRRVSPL
ncbi:uncharacterized protein V6R79_004959 [Siganus canaliculatus]